MAELNVTGSQGFDKGFAARNKRTSAAGGLVGKPQWSDWKTWPGDRVRQNTAARESNMGAKDNPTRDTPYRASYYAW